MNTLATKQQLEQIFMDNLSIIGVEHGLVIETYGKIDSETQMGSCHYSQFYDNTTSKTEAKKRFIDFYLPMNLEDNNHE